MPDPDQCIRRTNVGNDIIAKVEVYHDNIGS